MGYYYVSVAEFAKRCRERAIEYELKENSRLALMFIKSLPPPSTERGINNGEKFVWQDKGRQ